MPLRPRALLPLAALALAACFGDNNQGPAPSPDASTPDDASIGDAGADTTVNDAGNPGNDAGSDAGYDAGNDGGSDTGSDAGPADASSVDASLDAPIDVQADVQVDAVGPDASVCANVDAGALGYRDTVLADSPIAYFRFGEASGTAAVDETGNVTDMTYRGSPTYAAPGAIANDPDTAISFNGLNAYAQSASTDFDFAPSSAYSIELWINPGATQGGFARVISREFADTVSADRQGYLMSWTGGSLSDERVANGADQAISAAVPAGVYSHVVATYDGATSTMYVNGVLVASGAAATPLVALVQDFAVAGFPNAEFADYFSGTIDELAVYPLALPASRALVHYCVGAGM